MMLDRNTIATNLNLNFDEGVSILMTKPIDMTSFRLVSSIRNISKTKKVGHAGTLDPKATGLMILCTGKSTKSISTFVEQTKEYEGSFEIGARTSSYDVETEIIEKKDFSIITENDINEIAKTFIGRTEQIPPMYSAIKIKGKPLYKLARKGVEVERMPREIFIYSFEILKCELPIVHFRLVCSKGTYVRSLVNDIGVKLNVGAYLKSLSRTKIGNYNLNDALTLDDIRQYFNVNKS